MPTEKKRYTIQQNTDSYTGTLWYSKVGVSPYNAYYTTPYNTIPYHTGPPWPRFAMNNAEAN